MEVQTKNALEVELFQVAMPSNGDNTCSTCETVQTKLVSAINEVQKIFDHIDCEILFKQTTVKTIEQAVKAKISASPTIRVGNLDFYPMHLSKDGEERKWIWNGHTFSEPDKKTLIEVLMKGYFEPQQNNEIKNLSPYIQKYLTTDTEQPKTNCGCK